MYSARHAHCKHLSSANTDPIFKMSNAHNELGFSALLLKVVQVVTFLICPVMSEMEI